MIVRAALLVVVMASVGHSADRLAVPSDAALAAMSATVQEVYKQDIAAAKTPVNRLALAAKLLRDGVATQDDPVGRFVLLRAAQRMAVADGDLAIALEAIDITAKEYLVDELELRADAVEKGTPSAKTIAQLEVAFRQCYVLSQRALLADRFELADDLCLAAQELAKKTKNAELTKRWTQRRKQVALATQAFAALKDQFATLEQQPADPIANLAVGRFRCLQQGDWKRGLAMLALGNDDKLAPLAARELMSATGPAALARDWYELAKTLKDEERSAAEAHSAECYRQALPQATGLERTQVQTRIKELAGLEVPVTQRPNGLLAMRIIDCATEAHNLPWGPGIDLLKSWTLHFDFVSTGPADGEKTIFIWGDNRVGHDPLQLWIDGRTFRTSWDDCVAETNQRELQCDLADSQFKAWVNVKLHFDALTRTMRLYVDDLLLAEAPRKVLPMPDKPMPAAVGGHRDYPWARFTGQVRNVWMGNHE